MGVISAVIHISTRDILSFCVISLITLHPFGSVVRSSLPSAACLLLISLAAWLMSLHDAERSWLPFHLTGHLMRADFFHYRHFLGKIRELCSMGFTRILTEIEISTWSILPSIDFIVPLIIDFDTRDVSRGTIDRSFVSLCSWRKRCASSFGWTLQLLVFFWLDHWLIAPKAPRK